MIPSFSWEFFSLDKIMLKFIENLYTWVFTHPVPNHLQNFESKHSYMTNEDTEHQRGRYLSRAIQLDSGELRFAS